MNYRPDIRDAAGWTSGETGLTGHAPAAAMADVVPPDGRKTERQRMVLAANGAGVYYTTFDGKQFGGAIPLDTFVDPPVAVRIGPATPQKDNLTVCAVTAHAMPEE